MPNVAEQITNINAECKPITNIDNFIRRQLNKGQKKIQTMGPPGGWHFLYYYGQTLSVVANTKEYGLSPLVDTSKVINIWDETNGNYLHPLNRQKFLMGKVTNDVSGSPLRHMHKGFWPVQKQPTASSTISLASNSASDSLNVKIQYLTSAGVFLEENLAISGTATVTTASAATKILALYKDAASIGVITVTQDTPSTTLLTISPKDQSMSCPVIELYYYPSASGTLYYDFCMKLPEIYDDDDVSLLPEQYHEGFEIYAKWQVYKTLEKWNQAKICEKEFYEFVENMKKDVYVAKGVTSPDEFRTSSISAGYFDPRNPVT